MGAWSLSALWFLLLMLCSFWTKTNGLLSVMTVFESTFGLALSLILTAISLYFVQSFSLKPAVHDLFSVLFAASLCVLFQCLATLIMAISIWDGLRAGTPSAVPDSMRVIQCLFQILFLTLS